MSVGAIREQVRGDADARAASKRPRVVPVQPIAGGTDEIQHNILGEQIPGLPREPSVDRDIPFRDIRRSAP